MAEIDYEFAIPMTRDDLLRKTGNHYVVNEKLSLRQIPAAVQDFKVSLRKGPFSMLDHFDSLFTILCLHKDIDQSLKEEAWHLLLRSTSLLAIELEDNIDHLECRLKHLNALKMTCYLLCQFMEMFEKEETGTQIATAQSKKKKKALAGDFDLDKEKQEGVQMLLRLVKLNLNKLWDPPIAEEEFVSLITNCCYKLLENSTINRCKETRDSIFHLIGVMVKRYNHYLAASLKIIQLLQHFEHLASPLAQAVDMFVEEYGVKYVASEITREIGRMDSVDLERDASGCRSYAIFLVELSEKIPGVMLQNMSTLICHLDGEVYSMRNAVLSMMGEIIVKVLSADKLEENLKTTRDDFLDTLEDHIHDIHAFVRSKVLQIWTHIVNEKCLPLQRQESLVSAVVGRLQDVSSQVRRHAIQLITALLKSNPFAAKLQAEKLKETYEKETEKLKEMIAENSEFTAETMQPKSFDAWTQIEKTLKVWLENKDTDSPEESSQTLEDEDNEQKALDTIYQYLNEGKFVDAVQLLKCAQEKWPDNNIFQYMDEDKDKTDESEEEKCREISESSLLQLLKDIFVRCYEASALSQQLNENPSQNEDNSVVNDLTKQQVLVHYLQDCYTFANQIQTAVPIISQLLGSKVITDAQESIEFFVTGVNFGVSSALIGVRKMLALIWSKESSIKDAVIDAYQKLYMNPQAGNQRAKALQIVKNLSTLTFEATLGELTSLEQLVAEFMKSGEIDSDVIQILWEIFTMKIPNTTSDESRAALILLSMAAGAEKSIIKSNIDVLIKEGLGCRAEDDFLLPKLTCQALLKLGQKNKNKGELAAKPFRLPKDHELFSKLGELLQKGLKNPGQSWIPLADVAVNVIYRLAEHPDSICGNLLRKIAMDMLETNTEGENEKAEENRTVPSYQLARFLSLAGDVAFRQLVHVDFNISGEMKRRRAVQEQSRPPKKSVSNDTVNKTKNQTVTENNEGIEDELGLGNAGAEDAEAEYIRAICEKEIVTGQTILSAISPLLSHVCHNQAKFSDPQLQTAATLALSKFMMVSSDFCDSHLQLLFTILEKSKHSTIRANTIIALGDLTIRFPNMIEPWTPNLYARLRDDSPTVRKNTLQVLTHLILNDRVKVKGQLSEMASCITDDDPRISGMAKLFFHELSHKGNAVYNIMPDIISRLSDPDVGVEDDHFHSIMEYLFSFIQKDKQCESLVEKLCLRYKATNSERQWRHLAFCMSMLSYSEKCVRKLQENFSCFADKLGDQEIHKCFCTILSSAKKFAKTGAKTTIDELEERIEQCHSKGAEEMEVAMKASHATKSKGKTPRKAKTPAKTPGKKKGRKAVSSSESEVENVSPVEPRSTRKRKPVKKPELVFSSDEESDFELFDVDKSKKGICNDDTADLLNSDSDENFDPLSPDNYRKNNPKTRKGRTPLRSRRILSSPIDN